MDRKYSRKLNKLCLVSLLFSTKLALAANFLITPYGTLPTTVIQGQSVSANYTVTNLTHTSRYGYFIAGLPATVTQNGTAPNCSNPINLAANASCNLRLDITGAVSSNFAICKGNSCTTATTPLHVSVSSNPTPTPRAAKFAYVTNNGASGSLGDPTVSVCAIDQATGLITSCQGAGGDNVIAGIFANGITLNNAGTQAFLNSQDNSNANVYQCSINSADGTFTACTPTLITSPTGYYANYGFLTLNPSNTLAYLIDGQNSRVLACPIISGTVGGVCPDTGANNIDDSAVGIVLNKAGTTAYIGNYDGFVTVCSVNGATFSNCVQHTGGGAINFSHPSGVALNNAETMLYIADYSTNEVYRCSPDFSSCAIAASIPVAYGIALNETNTLAYVTNFTDTYMCHIEANGDLSVCTPQSGFNVPIDVKFGY